MRQISEQWVSVLQRRRSAQCPEPRLYPGLATIRSGFGKSAAKLFGSVRARSGALSFYRSCKSSASDPAIVLQLLERGLDFFHLVAMSTLRCQGAHAVRVLRSRAGNLE